MPDFGNTSAWVALVGLVVIWGIDRLMAALRSRGVDLPTMARQIKDLHDAEKKRQDRHELVSLLKEKKTDEQSE